MCPASRPGSQGWIRLCFDGRHRLTMKLGLKAPQSLIDRDQFDDRAPRVDEILKGSSDLRKRIQDLVHSAERDLAGNDRGSEQEVGKDDVGLQIDNPADVEVHEIQIEPEVVPANVAKQLA